MAVVRTVVGDIDPVDLGITYAHEHLAIDGGRPVELSPDFLLADVDRLVEEVSDAVAAGWGDASNGTLTLLGWMVEDGLADRIVLGMDAARRGYLRAYGGRPGLRYLLVDFTAEMASVWLGDEVRHALFVENPARAFAFAERLAAAADGGTR